MNELLKGREFQLWEYHISHGSLLIRSPATPSVSPSIDIMCVGVEYISTPRYFGEINITNPMDAEVSAIQAFLKKTIDPGRIWVFQSYNNRFLIAGLAIKIQKHYGDIFESPFA